MLRELPAILGNWRPVRQDRKDRMILLVSPASEIYSSLK